MAAAFERKTALVTGAGAGIGAATARLLAVRGAAVVLADLDEAAAACVAGECRREGGHADAIACDVRLEEDCAQLITHVQKATGRLDVLVNAAGIVRYGRVTELTVDDWDAVLSTNLTGVFHVLRNALPLIRESGGGSVVNVVSAQAFASQPLVAAYAATKGALVAMTRTLALDHAEERIRVNCVAPGSVDTPMLRRAAERFSPDAPERAIDQWGRNHPLGRVISPDEVAQVIAFLAGDEASAVTGATYLVDGGLTARLAT